MGFEPCALTLNLNERAWRLVEACVARADERYPHDALDYLAARFMEEGWSIKRLHKVILLSCAYQQGSQDNPKAARVDHVRENAAMLELSREELDRIDHGCSPDPVAPCGTWSR